MQRFHSWGILYLRLKLVAIGIRAVLGPAMMAGRLLTPSTPGVVKKRTSIPSREPGRSIAVIIHSPDGVSPDKKLPVHITAHGSGFVIPSLGADSDFCDRVSKTLGMIVIDIDYRKSPEYPFPAALEDFQDAIAWVHSKPDLYDTTKVSTGGFSAGGNLALAAGFTMHEKITAVGALYPPCNFTIGTSKKTAPKKSRSGMPLTPAMARFFDQSYILPDQARDDPRLSLVLADPSKFPKHIFCATGDGDMLYRDGRKFIERLQASGHPDATFFTADQEGHGFDKFPRSTESKAARDAAWQGVIDVIKRGWEAEGQPKL